MKIIKLFLTYQLKNSKSRHKTSGFTLIEILLGLILAFLIITPLLGFMVNIMTTDRQEQAKTNSEQEVQAALDYIARDLDQAIFVYDGYGLGTKTKVVQNLPYVDAKHIPVLVFWKRYFYPNVISAGSGKNDSFVLSLVAYYLIDNSDCSNPNWSCTAQIGRVEIRDGVNNATPPIIKDPGFTLFDTTASGTVEDQMNAWPKTAPTYGTSTPQIEILADYIDQTPAGTANAPQASCPDTKRDFPRPDIPNPTAAQTRNPPVYPYRQVPYSATPNNVRSSFYSCVDSDAISAQVFIRGNALARLSPRNKNQTPGYTTSKSTYFPQANIRVKGGGLITNNNQS